MLRISSKYRDVKLNALISSAWLSLEIFFYEIDMFKFDRYNKLYLSNPP